MVFSSLTFLLFFLPLTLALYFVRRGIRWRNGVLLAASLLFYSWSDPVWIVAMLLSTLANWVCAYMISTSSGRRARKAFLAAGVLYSLGLLFYCKYAGFFLGMLPGVRAPEVTMPVGISFYTFQIITYTVDVYRRKVRAQRNPLRLLLYVSCFPQLIAGPIVGYADVDKALGERCSTSEDFSRGMSCFAVGLAKKVLIANVCGAALAKTTLAGGGAALSFAGAWYSALLYALQIYYDFSAYSDMAIGLGRVFGFRYRENFRYPYLSRGVSEFWRRWHISLGSFFREYVYIPLGGNRRGARRTALNLLIVWTLTGLWHGASWSFVLWGAYYGALILLERFPLKRFAEAMPGALRWLLTLALVLFGWVIFYYENLGDAFTHIGAMLGFAGAGWIDAGTLAVVRTYTVFPLIAALGCAPVAPTLRALFGRLEGARAVGAVALTLLMGLSLLFLVGQSYNPFIYFRF